MDMLRKRRRFLFLLLSFLLVGLTLGAALPLAGRSAKAVSPQSLRITTHSSTIPLGSPAITPRLATSSEPASRSTGSASSPTATYTASDVTAYLQHHPRLPRVATIGGRFLVDQIRFLSSQAVSNLLQGASTGYPDNALLCYVHVLGNFLFPGPAGVQSTFTQGFLIFDGQTGNFVISGGLPGRAAQIFSGGTFAFASGAPSRPWLRLPPVAHASLGALLQPASARLPHSPARPASMYNCQGFATGHCYGAVAWGQSKFAQPLGGGEVAISYLNLQGGDGTLDNEMWVVQGNNTACANFQNACWIEAGMIDGSVEGFAGTHYFWAENRPTPTGGVFTFHDLGAVPAADQNPSLPPTLAIYENGTNNFEIEIIGSAPGGSLMFISDPGNTMTPTTLEMGQELEGTNGADSGGSARYSGLTYLERFTAIAHPLAVTPSSTLQNSPPFITWLTPEPSTTATFITFCC